MSNELKKILIISSYAPPYIGGPQTLFNLLRDFPSDQYSILTSYYNISNLSATKGTWLDGKYIFYDNPQATKETRKQGARNEKIANKIGPNIILKLKLLMKKLWLARTLLGFPIIFSQIFLIVRNGKKVIKKEKNKLLLATSDYGPAILGSYFLHKITKRPLSLFLFDLYKGNSFPFPGNLLANIFEKKIFKSTTTIIVTNQGTKDFYHKRYGNDVSKKIIVIYNSVFPDKYQKIENINLLKETSSLYNIIFTGNVYWPQLGAIKNLIKAINELKELDIKFKLYSPMPKDYLAGVGILESDKIKISFAPPQDIPKIQNEADILFIPLSWNTESQAIIDTATPAKLTDYLIAGKPILIHAPSSSFLVKYAKDNNFAEVVDEENIEKLKESIKKLLMDKEFSNTIVKNAKETFFKNHDANKNAQAFQNLLTK